METEAAAAKQKEQQEIARKQAELDALDRLKSSVLKEPEVPEKAVVGKTFLLLVYADCVARMR